LTEIFGGDGSDYEKSFNKLKDEGKVIDDTRIEEEENELKVIAKTFG
jgi:hypothetical protein